MEQASSISQIAGLLADPKRSAMVWALIDGAARPSDELAHLTGLSQSSASAHLARLSACGLLTREARGRQRYFRLANPELGAAIEALASIRISPLPITAVPSPAPSDRAGWRRARQCQDHLGGQLGGDLFSRMIDSRWLEVREQRVWVSPKGIAGLARLGIYIQALVHREHQSLCACCNWSERRPHLGGSLGRALLRLCLQSGWLRKEPDSRALHLTTLGAESIAMIAREAKSA